MTRRPPAARVRVVCASCGVVRERPPSLVGRGAIFCSVGCRRTFQQAGGVIGQQRRAKLAREG